MLVPNKASAEDFMNITRIGNSVNICNKKISIDISDINPCYVAITSNMAPTTKERFDSWIMSKHGSIKGFENYLYKNQSKAYVKHNFLVHEDGLKLTIYRRKNDYSNELAYVTNSKSSRWLDDMLHDVKIIAKDITFISKPSNQAKKDLELAVYDQTYERITQPIMQISNNKDKYCYAYVPLDELCEKNKFQETPAWDNFLHQFEHVEERELFMAFIYSIFKDNNKGRQILWLHGQGLSGKSTVARVIYHVMKSFNEDMAQSKENRLNLNSFSYELLERSRLVVISDTKDRGLLHDTQTLQLTGNDVAVINKKFQASVTKQIYSKLIVCSNYAPYINMYAKHEVTRLLYLKLNDELCNERYQHWSRNYSDINWEEKLAEEFWSFMFKCKEFYFKYVKPDNNFTVPECIMNKIKSNCSNNVAKAAALFFEHCVVVQEDSKLSIDKVFSKFRDFMSAKTVSVPMKANIVSYIKGNGLNYKEQVHNGIELKYLSGYAFKEDMQTYDSLTLGMMNDE